MPGAGLSVSKATWRLDYSRPPCWAGRCPCPGNPHPLWGARSVTQATTGGVFFKAHRCETRKPTVPSGSLTPRAKILTTLVLSASHAFSEVWGVYRRQVLGHRKDAGSIVGSHSVTRRCHRPFPGPAFAEGLKGVGRDAGRSTWPWKRSLRGAVPVSSKPWYWAEKAGVRGAGFSAHKVWEP